MKCANYYRYLPVSDESMSWGAYVTSVGRVSMPQNVKYPPAGHPAVYNFDWRRGRVLPEFAIVLITAGEGLFDSKETGEVRFQAPTVLFLFPGVWHRYRPVLETGWTERWICFNGEIAHRLAARETFSPQNPVVRVTEETELAQHFDELIRFAQHDAAQEPVLFSLYVLGLLAHALSLADVETQRKPRPSTAGGPAALRDPLARDAKELIWNHSHRTLSVDDIAQTLEVPRRTLDRRFAEAVGHSVLDEINACRLSRAKRLLEETELPLKMVSFLAGFSSPDRMRILFEDREGALPSLYRRKAKQRPYRSSK
jgi:AraC-like DNA-binding protein